MVHGNLWLFNSIACWEGKLKRVIGICNLPITEEDHGGELLYSIIESGVLLFGLGHYRRLKVDRWQLITLANWKSLELAFQTQLRTQLYPESLDVGPHTSNGFRSRRVRSCVLKLCFMHLSSEFYVAFFHSLILLCTPRPWKLCVSKLLGFEKKSNCSRTKQKMETKF